MKKMKCSQPHPFTIIELIVVMALIGIVLTLAIAPFDKLTTVAGVDGAGSMISTQIRACRQHAISKRTRVALVLYRNAATQAMRTVELYKDDTFSSWTDGSAWTFLPVGAVIEDISSSETVALTGAQMEPIASSGASYKAVIFKPTGKLANGSPPTLKISDAIWDGSVYRPRGDGNNYVDLTVNRFTGQVTISGP